MITDKTLEEQINHFKELLLELKRDFPDFFNLAWDQNQGPPWKVHTNTGDVIDLFPVANVEVNYIFAELFSLSPRILELLIATREAFARYAQSTLDLEAENKILREKIKQLEGEK